MRLRLILCALAVALLVPASANAQVTSSPATTKLGKQLVTRFWTLLRNEDRAGLRRFLSPAFQVQRADGTGAKRDAYIASVGTKIQITGFKLSGFIVTRSGDVLVARFTAAADEVIDGEPYPQAAEPRIATFALVDGAWRMTSNANFNAPTG